MKNSMQKSNHFNKNVRQKNVLKCQLVEKYKN